MKNDTKTVRDDERGAGATEDKIEKIREIQGSEVLGYAGAGREEHSGQNSPSELSQLDDLADNKPEDV
jgi:hypothetical protein